MFIGKNTLRKHTFSIFPMNMCNTPFFTNGTHHHGHLHDGLGQAMGHLHGGAVHQRQGHRVLVGTVILLDATRC